MAVKPIPDGYHSVTPYLIVPGVPRLIQFLKQAFGALESRRTTLPDGRVMHAEVQIGDSRVMMGEASDRWPAMPSSIHLYVPDVDAAYARAVAAGGESIFPPRDEFYGDRMGGVRDPSGNCWWVATHTEDVSPEEMARREEAAINERSKA